MHISLRGAQRSRSSMNQIMASFLDEGGIPEQTLWPTAFLPEQYYGTGQSARKLRGEAALMSAVLEDAIHCFRKQFVKKGRRVQRLAREAEEWLFSDDDRWPFSFLNICAVLGLDPGYVRKGLARWRRQVPPVPRRKGWSAMSVRQPHKIAA